MPMLADTVDAVIGVDTHTDTHTAAVVTPLGGCVAVLQVTADAAGYAQLIREAGSGPSQQEMANMITGYFASLPPEHFPNLTRLSGEFSLTDSDERFELLLDIFVDGLARRADGSASR